MYPTKDEVRRLKLFWKGQKYYRPVLFLIGRHPRQLRRTTRTANGAMRYGELVLERYRRWCNLAQTKKLKEARPVKNAVVEP